MKIADGLFLEWAENILITGATGCGKSYLACALGRQACSLGYRVLYFGINKHHRSGRQPFCIEGFYELIRLRVSVIY